MLAVAMEGDRVAFLDQLKRHERGETGYVAMSEGLAASGVERWTVDTQAMTMTFYNRAGDPLLADPIT